MEISRQHNLLLIEDSPSDALLVISILKNAENRFAVEQAGTLAEGFEKIERRPFDIVLLDLSLPDSHGITTLEMLTEKNPQLPVIVLTSAEDIQLESEAVRKGAQDFLLKQDTSSDVLVRAVDYAIWRKQSQLTLQRTVQALKEANTKILEQQKSVIEEERLKVMLQMAGATAHELNQPLMSLLGYLELIELESCPPQKYLSGIKKAGERIASIVKKIQSIRLDCVIPHVGGPGIISLDQAATFLSVEDSDNDFRRLEEILKDQPQVTLLRAVTIEEAFRIIDAGPAIKLVFLDHVLPDGTSFDFMRILEEKRVQLPVVVITGQGDEMVASHIIQAGAYDYINKDNLNLPSVTRIIKNAMEKFHLKKEMQRAFDKMTEMATRDELTGLNNRRLMYESLQREMLRVERYGSDLACLMLDLDHFKQINDTFGHLFGDSVLKEFAATLKRMVRSTDLIFRYGGEEFVILLPESNLYDGLQMAEKIRSHFETKQYQCQENAVVITVSIGAAAVMHHGAKEGRDLLSFADKALYSAKANGRNQIQIYKSALEGASGSSEVPIQYVKDQIKMLLEKTRKSAIASIERLVVDRSQMGLQTDTQRVVTCLELLARKLNFPTAVVETLKQAAQLHDYLQVILMESLLCKQTPLNSAERAEIEDHPKAVTEMVELFDFFNDIRKILLYHHEHYDGSGYPEGLHGDQIPIGARLLSVINAFVAMTSEKSYRPRLSDEDVVNELVHGAQTQFDPVMVALVLEMIEHYNLLKVGAQTLQNARQRVKTICEEGRSSLKNLICNAAGAEAEALKFCEDK